MLGGNYMNQLYHFIQKYHNWQKYLHLITFNYSLTNEGNPTFHYSDGRQSWGYIIRMTFYYDCVKKKMFKVIEQKEQRTEQIDNGTYTGLFRDANEGIKKEVDGIYARLEQQKQKIMKSEEYLSFFKDENLTINSLIKEAEECMLEANPLRTSNFLVAFLEKFKPIKKV